MGVIRWIMTIAIIAVSIVMTVVILMQEGRSQGLGAISGAAETYWGKNSLFSQSFSICSCSE